MKETSWEGSYAGGERDACVLLTDIHRSTTLWEHSPDEFSGMLDKHNAVVEQAVEAHGGEIMKNLGDGYIALFASAPACVSAMIDVNRGIGSLPELPDGTQLRVRVVAHEGRLRRQATGRGYFGPPLNRASRICQVCHPGQALMSEDVRKRLGKPPEGAELVDLGIHHLRDLAEPEHLFQLRHPDFALQDFPPLPTLSFRPNNLLVQLNSFVGREKEISELIDMLRSGKYRLITVVSPGGYGKSRLTVQLCADALDDYPNGVFQVLLAPVADVSGILGATADALRFKFYGQGEQKQQLIDYLREKQMLVCFDNFEHLTAGAPIVADILAQAAGLKVLVTSREPLHLSGEKVYRLEPLAVAAGGKDGDGARDLSDAEMLFIDRAALVKHDLAFTEESLSAIRTICAKLDGVPLSIELAAAWTDNFTLPELLSEVEHQLELTSRMADVPERHRSVRASLDWSYKQLSKEQRSILRALSIFKGGFYIDAAQAVVPKASGMKLRERLAELSDKGWLFSREVEGKTRFYLRDAASHEHALEKLRASADYERVASAHCRHFARLAEEEGRRLEGHGQLEALKVLAVEMDNIYESLRTALRQGDEQALLSFAEPVVAVLEVTSRFQEGLDWYEQMVTFARKLRNESLLCRALMGLGSFLESLDRYEESTKALLEAKDLGDKVGDRRAAAMCLKYLGDIRGKLDDDIEAVAFYEQGLALSREAGYRYGIAASMNGLANAEARKGHLTASCNLHAEALSIRREIGDYRGVVITLNNLGNIRRGDPEVARPLLEESLALAREIGESSMIMYPLSNLKMIEQDAGNIARAREIAEESLAISREIGAPAYTASALLRLGRLESDAGNAAAARACFSEALSLAREMGANAGGNWGILGALADEEVREGNLSLAKSLLSEAINGAREAGGSAGWFLCSLADIDLLEGNTLVARERYLESLAVEREVGKAGPVVGNLRMLAYCEQLLGNYPAARRYVSETLEILQRQEGVETWPEVLAACAGALAVPETLRSSATTLYGALHLAAERHRRFDPADQKALDEAQSAVDAAVADGRLSKDELDGLRQRAEAMTMREIIECVLKELQEDESAPAP